MPHPSIHPLRAAAGRSARLLSLLCCVLPAACDAPEDLEASDMVDTDVLDEELLDELDEELIDDPTGGVQELGPDGGIGFQADADPSEISAMGYASWGTPGNNGAPLDLGPSHDRTCFLQGVTGELESAWQTPAARVSVYEKNGRWWLETKAGYPTFYGEGGSGVMGHATCIPVTNNRRFISWAGNTKDSSNTLYSWVEDTGSTKCFLTSVSGTVGWASPNSYVRVKKQTIYGFGDPFPGWLLHGHLLTEQDGTSGGSAAAVCVDMVLQSASEYSWQSAPTSSGSSTLVEKQAGTTCGVEVLGGNFAANPGGWSDGARILPAWDWWLAYSSLGKTIGGRCYSNIVLQWPGSF